MFPIHDPVRTIAETRHARLQAIAHDVPCCAHETHVLGTHVAKRFACPTLALATTTAGEDRDVQQSERENSSAAAAAAASCKGACRGEGAEVHASAHLLAM